MGWALKNATGILVCDAENALQITLVLDALDTIAVGVEMNITVLLHKWTNHTLNDLNLIIWKVAENLSSDKYLPYQLLFNSKQHSNRRKGLS